MGHVGSGGVWSTAIPATVLPKLNLPLTNAGSLVGYEVSAVAVRKSNITLPPRNLNQVDHYSV